MKRLFRNKIISHGLCFVLGAIIFGSIGIVATNYLLKAEDVEYVDKDNNSTTVQNAITDLYNQAASIKNETLPIGTVTKTHNSITIPYTGSYDTVLCIYGTGNNNTYGSLGTINSNTCNITGLQPETSYDYKIIAADSTGKVYEGHGTIETDEAPAVEYYSNPAIVYFNPVTNQQCNNYTSSNSNTGTKTGCMKWYAYKKEGNDYSLLLDHNTTAMVPYNTSENNENYGTTSGNVGYDLALLTTSTSSGGSGWNSSLNPRLISAEEIKEITGNTSWDASSSDYYFGSLNTTHYANQTEEQKAKQRSYAWLYDYTKGCTTYGCNTADDSTYGYWTSSKFLGNSRHVWYVLFGGNLQLLNARYEECGLRPVIEVSSSILNIS